MSKTGLVLEGGGMRGIYTAGVLDVFMERGISFDGVIGVSAGAVHGCSYLSGQRGRSLRYYMKYCRDPRFMSIRSFLKTGNIVGVDFCYHELPDKLDIYDNEAFLEANIPFYATVTNVETGKPEHLLIKDMRKDIDYLRASASLPYLSKFVEIDGKKYLDGGCSDSVPINAFRNMGYSKNVVVLTRPEGARKKPGHKYAKIIYRKNPELVKTLLDHHNMYNRAMERVEELERDGEIFVIRPKEPLKIGRLENDPKQIERVYNIGRADAEGLCGELESWFMKAKNTQNYTSKT